MNAYISDMRAMRQRLKAALKRGLVAVLDVGTAKTVCFILKVDPAALDQAMGPGIQSPDPGSPSRRIGRNPMVASANSIGWRR